MRTAYDFSPLYRSMIGIDRVADLIEAATKSEGDGGYPPYDVEKTGESAYRIAVAAAGFHRGELEIVAQPNLLVVTGRKAQPEAERSFLHRGIAARNFERRFELADHVVVKAAEYVDGVLSIELARELPEALKPRRIEIGQAEPQPKRIEASERRRQAA